MFPPSLSVFASSPRASVCTMRPRPSVPRMYPHDRRDSHRIRRVSLFRSREPNARRPHEPRVGKSTLPATKGRLLHFPREQFFNVRFLNGSYVIYSFVEKVNRKVLSIWHQNSYAIVNLFIVLNVLSRQQSSCVL